MFKKLLFFFLPKKIISELVGYLMSIEGVFGKIAIKLFVKTYKVNINESEKNINEYKSLANFFSRKLKKDVRIISDNEFVHPVDGVLRSIHQVSNNLVVQVKNKKYNLKELLKFQIDIPDTYQVLNYYLAPHNYHRLHYICNGTISEVCYIPSTLWPVNDWAINNIKNLFCLNSRVVITKESSIGTMYYVLVGALNVGKIILNFMDKNINKTKSYKKLYITREVKKSEEIGYFAMGSSLLVIAKSNFKNINLNEVKVGESIV